jgi:hypothetical protein
MTKLDMGQLYFLCVCGWVVVASERSGVNVWLRRPLQIQFDPCIHAATPTMGLFVSAACGIAAQRIGGLQNRDCDRVF